MVKYISGYVGIGRQHYRNMLVGGQYHIQSHKLDKIGATPILKHPNGAIVELD